MRGRGGWIIALVVAVVAVIVVVSSGGSDGSGGSTKSKRAAAASSASDASAPSAPKQVDGPHRDPVPILMYHVIAAPKGGVSYGELYVPKETFQAQVDAIAAAGYHGVTLDQVDDYWRKGYALPDKPIVFSFDDGYQSQYTTAMPILRKHGWPGVLNLAVKNLDPAAGAISPRMVKALIKADWEVDAHSIDHLDVSTLDGAELERQVAGSRKQIQQQFGVPVNSFCYPSGRFDDTAIAAVKRAGFKTATTTEPGLGRPSQPYTLARVRVNGTESASSLVDQLRSYGS